MTNTVKVTLNWKSFAAVGLGATGIILAVKLDSNQAMQVLTHAVDACGGFGMNKLAG